MPRSSAWLWQIPLAIASFMFYRLVRTLLKGVIALHRRASRNKPRAWQAITGETVARPLILPTIMATAPRWNPHAVTASLGPLEVRERMTIDLEAMRRSAAIWTVVVNAFPTLKTVASQGSLEGDQPESSGTLRLEPGLYMVAVRCYHWSDRIELPEVKTDGQSICPPLVLPGEPNGWFRALASRRTWFYRALQYYVFVMLERRRQLPARFVHDEFLPQPNPETRFAFDCFRRGDVLTITLASGLLSTWDVYLTCYDRASFPMVWYAIVDPEHSTAPLPEDGFYLVRIVRRGPAENEPAEPVIIRVGQPGARAAG